MPQNSRSLKIILVGAGLAWLTACAAPIKPMGPAAPVAAPPPPPPSAAHAVPPPGAVSQTAPAGAPAPGSQGDFVIHAQDRVYFDFDSYRVRADAAPILQAQAAWLMRYPATPVRIEGNCDERGTREYNFALGARRAQAVKEALVALGVSAQRISTVSYGKERPLDTNGGEAADQRNRNAHTAVGEGAAP